MSLVVLVGQSTITNNSIAGQIKDLGHNVIQYQGLGAVSSFQIFLRSGGVPDVYFIDETPEGGASGMDIACQLTTQDPYKDPIKILMVADVKAYQIEAVLNRIDGVIEKKPDDQSFGRLLRYVLSPEFRDIRKDYLDQILS